MAKYSSKSISITFSDISLVPWKTKTRTYFLNSRGTEKRRSPAPFPRIRDVAAPGVDIFKRKLLVQAVAIPTLCQDGDFREMTLFCCESVFHLDVWKNWQLSVLVDWFDVNLWRNCFVLKEIKQCKHYFTLACFTFTWYIIEICSQISIMLRYFIFWDKNVFRYLPSSRLLCNK